MGYDQIIVPFLDGQELDDLVQRPFLVFLRLGMHIRRAHRYDRRAAIVGHVALLVEMLAQRFSQELDVPFGQGFQAVAIRHEYFYRAAVLRAGQVFQHAVEHQQKYLPP